MITFKDVSKTYGTETTVLEGINFTLEKGSFSFLIGPTGSGKTTIFRLLIRDLLPTTGEITLGELDLINLPKKNIPHLRRKVGVIFQDLKLLMDRTVTENVTLPLELAGVKAEEALQKAESILEEVGLGSKKDRFPLQLSGGEKQRVAIARALIFDPEVILADEPTGNLDNQTSFQIVSLLESINKKGTTIFMATHNDKIVEKENSKRILIMEKGKIINEKNSKKESEKEEKTVEEKK